MPSADTLVKATGSTRVTVPGMGAAPLPVVSNTAAPGNTCRTSPESTSITASIAAVSPISSSDCPAVTGAALSRCSFSTWPFTGLLMAHRPAGRSPAVGTAWASAARASATAKSAMACSAWAAVRACCAERRARSVWSRADGAIKPRWAS